MKQVLASFLLVVCAGSVFAQAPAPYPIVADSQSSTIAAIDVFQANAKTFRVYYKSGASNNTITTEQPFLFWSPYGATNSTVVTAQWSIVSAASGVVDFVFTPADLNFATGTYSYQVGLDVDEGNAVVNQGTFRIKASQASIGADPIVFASTNVNWGLINWMGLPAFEYQTNLIATTQGIWAAINATNTGFQSQLDAKASTATFAASTASVWSAITANSNAHNTRITAIETGRVSLATFAATNSGLQSQIDAKLPTSTHASSTQAIWSAVNAIVSADNALTNIVPGARLSFSKTNAQGYMSVDVSGLATGSPIYSVAGLSTGAPIYVESDPVWVAASTGYLTKVSAASTYSTGTPLYAFTEVGTGTLNAASLTPYLATSTAASTYATITALSSSGAAHNARMDSITSAAASVYYPRTNPSNYVTGAQVATNIAAMISSNGFITGALASNSFVKKSGDTMTGPLVVSVITNASTISIYSSAGDVDISADGGQINFSTLAEFQVKPTIPGYVTTNGNINGLTGTLGNVTFPASLATTSSVAAAIIAGDLAQGAGATNAVNTMGSAVGLVATNFNLARGAQGTNAQVTASNAAAGVVAVGAVATGAQTTANAAVPWLSLTNAVQAQVITNIGESALIGGRTNAIISGAWTNSAFLDAAFIAGTDSNLTGASKAYWTVGKTKGADVYRGLRYNAPVDQWQEVGYGPNATTGVVLTTRGFSSSAYKSVASYDSEQTNVLKVYTGIVTQNQIATAFNVAFYDGTNLVFPRLPLGTNWTKFTGTMGP